jgi:hypothetical protein
MRSKLPTFNEFITENQNMAKSDMPDVIQDAVNHPLLKHAPKHMLQSLDSGDVSLLSVYKDEVTRIKRSGSEDKVEKLNDLIKSFTEKVTIDFFNDLFESIAKRHKKTKPEIFGDNEDKVESIIQDFAKKRVATEVIIALNDAVKKVSSKLIKNEPDVDNIIKDKVNTIRAKVKNAVGDAFMYFSSKLYNRYKMGDPGLEDLLDPDNKHSIQYIKAITGYNKPVKNKKDVKNMMETIL